MEGFETGDNFGSWDSQFQMMSFPRKRPSSVDLKLKERLNMKGIFAFIKIPGLLLCFVFAMLMASRGAAHASNKVFIIGIVNDGSIFSPAVEGFKAGMAGLGYVEGKNVNYVYYGVLEKDEKIISAEIRRLLSLKLDLLWTAGNGPTLLAKKATAGTGIPIIAASVINAVETGLVKSISHPDGNITGVQFTDNSPKALEWLKTIAPGLKKIYVPYSPDDQPSESRIAELNRAASKLGVSIVLQKVSTPKEAIEAVKKLETGVYGLFRMPSPGLDAKNEEFIRAAVKQGIPVGAIMPIGRGALMTFCSDFYDVGMQTARLALLIRQGVKPADIPMEMADSFLTINLKTAKQIGLQIPDNVLMQAKTIIR
jgi:putative tryptophan/tyrosine transport system substrate-binding protein